MPISFSCPHCGAETKVGEQYAGQSGPCKSCGQPITVPMPEGAAPAPKSSSSSSAVILAIVLIGGIGFLACSGLLVALLLPAVQASREAARRMSCSGHLKQIAIALHNYHDTYQSFPPAYTVDANGQPLHSWRTLILPFLEQQPLYSQIDLNEPWDSPKNRAFNRVVIPTYRCPSDPDATDSAYLAIVGPNCVFQGPTGVPIRSITDGTSNTILVVEVSNNPRSWMEPVDLDAAKITFPLNRGSMELGSAHPGGLNVSMADGSVQFISEAIDPKFMRAVITINGNENVSTP